MDSRAYTAAAITYDAAKKGKGLLDLRSIGSGGPESRPKRGQIVNPGPGLTLQILARADSGLAKDRSI